MVRSPTKNWWARHWRRFASRWSSPPNSDSRSEPRQVRRLDSRPEHIKEVADASLKRLKIDTIDLVLSAPRRSGRAHRGCRRSREGSDPGGQGQVFWLVRGRCADHSSRPCRAAGDRLAKRVLALVARARELRCSRPSKSSALALFRTVRWAGAFSPERSTSPRPSTARISATCVPRFTSRGAQGQQGAGRSARRHRGTHAGHTGATVAGLDARQEALDRSHPGHHQAAPARGKSWSRAYRAVRARTCRPSKRPRPRSNVQGDRYPAHLARMVGR